MLYLVLIGWLYVVAMITLVSDSLLKGVVRLLFLGVLPVLLVIWIKRLRRRAAPPPSPPASD
ncbi:MAG: hypothetical protein JNL19_02155 [Burkholderiales bacterium]|nr:hypothetical protein [Burkholderiales bacterium]